MYKLKKGGRLIYQFLWNSYWNKIRQVYGLDKLPSVGVVIIGRGNEQFALKPLQDGIIGVWKVGDPNSVMTILEYTTSGTVWDTGMGALGIYDEDPRNNWSGSFFDRLYEWTPAADKPGLYWNVGDPRFNDYYYEYKFVPGIGHTMAPTTIKTPWYGMFKK